MAGEGRNQWEKKMGWGGGQMDRESEDITDFLSQVHTKGYRGNQNLTSGYQRGLRTKG